MLARDVDVESLGGYFELLERVCFEFYGSDQQERTSNFIKHSGTRSKLAFAATAAGTAAVAADNPDVIGQVEDMMLVASQRRHELYQLHERETTEDGEEEIKSYFASPLFQLSTVKNADVRVIAVPLKN